MSFLIPGLLPILLASIVIFIGMDLLVSRLGWYRHAWHPALLRASLFTILFCATSLLLRPWH
jgi:protein AaeX